MGTFDVCGWLIDQDPLIVAPWRDAVVEAQGFPARSEYVETFWRPILGPSSICMLRWFASVLHDGEPAPVALADLGAVLGLTHGVGRNTPVVRTLDRLVHFGVAQVAVDRLEMRTVMPPLSRRQLARLPDALVRVHGRRGGRWAEGPVDAALAAIDTARDRGLADGTWPDGAPKGDRDCSVAGCGRKVEDHQPPCKFCGRAPEHHADGDLELERAGRVRMARARHAAGQPLDELDRQVLAESAAA